MEDFIAYSFIGLSAVLCILGSLSGRRMWGLKERGFRLARDIFPLALVSLDAWNGIPVFLLAADLLFCEAVLLQSVTVPQPRDRFPFMSALLSLACLARGVLDASGVRLHVDPATFMVLSAAFLLASGPFGEWLPWPRGRRETLPGAGRISSQNAACCRILGFSSTVVVALGSVSVPFTHGALLAISLILSLLYAFLYLQSSFGSRTLRFPAVFSPRKLEGGSMDEDQRMDMLFQRIEAYKQIEISQNSISQSKENLRLHTNYYNAGTCTMSDLLEAQTMFQQSKDRFVENVTQYEIRKTEYLQSIGR